VHAAAFDAGAQGTVYGSGVGVGWFAEAGDDAFAMATTLYSMIRRCALNMTVRPR